MRNHSLMTSASRGGEHSGTGSAYRTSSLNSQDAYNNNVEDDGTAMDKNNMVRHSRFREKSRHAGVHLEHLARAKNQQSKTIITRLIGPMQGENFEAESWVIHPNSIAAAVVLITSGTLLIYSAIQVPLDIGFYFDQDICDADRALLGFNVFVDTFFVLEIFFNFCVGVIENGTYVDNPWQVAKIYLRSRFWFDLVTSLPTSWFDIAAIPGCNDREAGAETESNGVTDALRFIRLLKPLRLVKLLRILKFAKIFDVLDSLLRISPQFLQICKLTFGVALLVHLLSCIFWLLKVQYDSSFDAWVVQWEVENSVSQQWLLAVYFINTVFTTVGFGDISGTNDVERIYSIFVMWVGTAVFAYIISALQQAGSEINEKNRVKNEHLQKVVRFMREKAVPAWMEQEVKAWVAFQHDSESAATETQQVMSMLSPKLQRTVAMQITSSLFRKAWVFSHLRHPETEHLLTKLILESKAVPYSKEELIASESTPESGLFIVGAGSVSLTVWVPEEDGDVIEIVAPPLTRGHFFGEQYLGAVVRNMLNMPPGDQNRLRPRSPMASVLQPDSSPPALGSVNHNNNSNAAAHNNSSSSSNNNNNGGGEGALHSLPPRGVDSLPREPATNHSLNKEALGSLNALGSLGSLGSLASLNKEALGSVNKRTSSKHEGEAPPGEPPHRRDSAASTESAEGGRVRRASGLMPPEHMWWGLPKGIGFEFRAEEHSEIVVLHDAAFIETLQGFPGGLMHEMVHAASLLPLATTDPVMRDIKLQIQLAQCRGHGPTARERRAILRWEVVMTKFIRIHLTVSEGYRQFTLLFNFSPPIGAHQDSSPFKQLKGRLSPHATPLPSIRKNGDESQPGSITARVRQRRRSSVDAGQLGHEEHNDNNSGVASQFSSLGLASENRRRVPEITEEPGGGAGVGWESRV